MQSGSQTTIFVKRSLTRSYCAHSRHSNCLKYQSANGGSRPEANMMNGFAVYDREEPNRVTVKEKSATTETVTLLP